MTLYLTKKQYDRWIKHVESSRFLRKKVQEADTTPFHVSRDPHDVSVVLKSIQKYGYRWFWFKNIRKFFPGCDGGVGLRRNRAVNVLQALEVDGFIRIHRNFNSHLSRYECLFDPHYVDDVYEKVVGKE